MKQEIIEFIKQQNQIHDEVYDQFLSDCFDCGEQYIQKFIGSKRLTTTLYLVLKEYVTYKFERECKDFSQTEIVNKLKTCFIDQTEIEQFFEKYRPLLINYRSLCGAEM